MKTNNPDVKKRSVLFCRASSEQAAQSQLNELRAYASSRNREVAGEFVLVASSASKQSQDAIDSIILRKREHNDFEELVVTNLARLTRKAAGDAHFLMSVFAKNGIRLVTLDYPISTDDPCPYLELDRSSGSPRALKQRSTTRTIFEMTASGLSPKEVANGLNEREGQPNRPKRGDQ